MRFFQICNFFPGERRLEQLLLLLNILGLLAKLCQNQLQKTKKSLSYSKFPTKISLNTRSNPGQTLKSFYARFWHIWNLDIILRHTSSVHLNMVHTTMKFCISGWNLKILGYFESYIPFTSYKIKISTDKRLVLSKFAILWKQP